jgi:hypothetical protein
MFKELVLLAGLAFRADTARAGSIFAPTAPAESTPSVSLPEIADFSFSDLPSFSEAGVSRQGDTRRSVNPLTSKSISLHSRYRERIEKKLTNTYDKFSCFSGK